MWPKGPLKVSLRSGPRELPASSGRCPVLVREMVREPPGLQNWSNSERSGIGPGRGAGAAERLRIGPGDAQNWSPELVRKPRPELVQGLRKRRSWSWQCGWSGRPQNWSERCPEMPRIGPGATGKFQNWSGTCPEDPTICLEDGQNWSRIGSRRIGRRVQNWFEMAWARNSLGDAQNSQNWSGSS